MKITFFIPTLLGGGAERVVVSLSNYLVNKGHDVRILNYKENESKYKLDERVNRDYYIPLHKPKFFLERIIRHFIIKDYQSKGYIGGYGYTNPYYRIFLRKYIKTHDTDCYIVLLQQSMIDLLSVSKVIKCPIIASERSYPELYSEFIQKELFKLSEKADAFVFQTEQAQSWYAPKVKKSIIIPNAVNSDYCKITPFNGIRKKKVVSVGRLSKEKNYDLLIRAFALANVPEFSLEIYGIGSRQSYLEEMIRENNLEGRVILKGFSSNIKEEIYDAALFVMSSNIEGIPNALLEAMALGLPCISTDFMGGGARVLIENNLSGVIVPPNNEKELSNAIRRVLMNESFAHDISIAANNRVNSLFSQEKIYDTWEKYIIEIVSEKESVHKE